MTDDQEDFTDYGSEPEREDYDKGRPAVRTALVTRSSKAQFVQIQDKVTGEWREVIRMTRIKFDDEAKAQFLDVYRKWGRMGEAASAAGVTPGTVRRAMENDDEFAEAVMIAETAYTDKLIRHHQNLVFNGQEKIVYDRNGGIVSREKVFPQRLIELELKKNDSGYRDKVETTVTIKRGVMVAPAEMESIDDWEKKFAGAIDVTPKEEEPNDDEEPLF